VAAWLKALIKLAAAAVKAREGNAAGVERHARRALELLADVRGALPQDADSLCGLELQTVEDVARSLAAHAATQFTQPQPDLLLTQALELAGD
jgi:hypothetical protein